MPTQTRAQRYGTRVHGWGERLGYGGNLKPPPHRCSVLLPTKRGVDETDLISGVGLELAHQDAATFLRRP